MMRWLDRGAGDARRGAVLAVLGVLALTVALLSGCSQLGIREADTGTTAAPGGATTTAGVAAAPVSSPSTDPLVSPAIAVAGAVGPSVVNVGVEGTAPGIFGSQSYAAEGSGVIFSSDGMIVTNNHVVSQESGGQEFVADKITVTLQTGEQLPATIVGRDPLVDLAVIKVASTTPLPAATFLADFSEVKIGQYAVAIGSPLGLENSVTLGIVSGVQRGLDTAQGAQQFSLVDLIQTDAAISPGNSGGALVDIQGRVIGINVAYLPPGQTGAVSVGFAIPSDLVVDVAKQLIDTGSVRHAYLGIRNTTVTPDLQKQFSLTRSSGVLVAGTDPGTPAAAAGLKQGDIVVQFDGHEIKDDADLFSVLRRKKPGDQVSITIDRKGTEQTLELTLGARPQ
ncbi:MAG: S1C family serine protease [Thermoleophilia bacterium]